jgi:hypothetical protein
LSHRIVDRVEDVVRVIEPVSVMADVDPTDSAREQQAPQREEQHTSVRIKSKCEW